MSAVSANDSASSAQTFHSSCVGCRRSKRKCDRNLPCNECKRSSKHCEYSLKAPRRNVQDFKELEDRLKHVEGLLQLSTQPSQLSPVTVRTSTSDRSVLDFEYGSHLQGGTTSAFAGRTQTPPASTSTYSLNAQPSTSRLAEFRSDLSALPWEKLERGRQTEQSLDRLNLPSTNYEWDERLDPARHGGNDGTAAALSSDEAGEGYLGFASAATLIRAVKRDAPDVPMSRVSTPQPQDADLPSAFRPEGWRPSLAEMTTYISAYFADYHMQYPIIHEPTFRAQMSDVIPKPSPEQWQFLLDVVLAIGAFCSSQAPDIINALAKNAIASITAEQLVTGSLVMVQGLILLSNVIQKLNRPNSGSVYLGIAVRMAIGLGLHRELNTWSVTPFEKEVRRRVWWAVRAHDSGASMTSGRPILLPTTEADAAMMTDVSDMTFTPSATSFPQPSGEITVYTAFIQQSRFHLMGNKLYSRAISTPPPSVSETLSMDAEVDEWYRSLPVIMRANSDLMYERWFRFARRRLYWRVVNLRLILLRRAFLEHATSDKSFDLSTAKSRPGIDQESCVMRCLDCASATIGDIHAYLTANRNPSRLESWYSLHFLCHACFVPLIALRKTHHTPQSATWTDDLRKTEEILKILHHVPLANRLLKVLDLLRPSWTDNEITIPDASFTDIFGDGSANFGFNQLSDIDFENGFYASANAGAKEQTTIDPALLSFAGIGNLESFWPGNMLQ